METEQEVLGESKSSVTVFKDAKQYLTDSEEKKKQIFSLPHSKQTASTERQKLESQ